MKKLLALIAIALSMVGYSQRITIAPIVGKHASGNLAAVSGWNNIQGDVILEVKVIENSQPEILLWPMPFVDQINTNFQWKSVEVWNTEGKKVADRLDNLSSLSPGFYIIKFNQTLTKTAIKL